MPTLIERIEQLLEVNTRIGVIVIDEDSRADSRAYEGDAHVTGRQVRLLQYARLRNLPIWYVDTTRRQLVEIVSGYSQFSTITKGDANAFGDGYSKQMPKYYDTGLHAELKAKGITHVVIMGFHVHCCVQITVGAGSCISSYGKGALQYGYEVLTSGDILRSSSDTRDNEETRCRWKDVEGVSYFDEVYSSPLLDSINQQYTATFFKKPNPLELNVSSSPNQKNSVNFCTIV